MELQGQILVPIHNLRGDICCVLDLDGNVISDYCYSAFGEQTGSDRKLPWGFASKRYDVETDLVYFGRRYYAPQWGRWITADPIGFADGPNLYAYVHNSVLTHFDLYGLYAWEKTPNRLSYFNSTKLFGCRERTTFSLDRPSVVFNERYMSCPLNAKPARTYFIGDKRIKRSRNRVHQWN